MTGGEWLCGPNVIWVDSSGSPAYDAVQVMMSEEIESSPQWWAWRDSSGFSTLELTIGISLSNMKGPVSAKRRRVGSELRVSVYFYEPDLAHMGPRSIWELAQQHLAEGFRQASEVKGVLPIPNIPQISYRPLPAAAVRSIEDLPDWSGQSRAWEEAATGTPPIGNLVPAEGVPTRFTIRPDDYHVPYAGTAQDGRRFFASQEMFSYDGRGWVGLFLWKPDGAFDEAMVTPIRRATGIPPGQATPGSPGEVLAERLAHLGAYVLEPITVEPFTRMVEGIEFGWKVNRQDGMYTINVEPGDFICYYEPWGGFEYDT